MLDDFGTILFCITQQNNNLTIAKVFKVSKLLYNRKQVYLNRLAIIFTTYKY